ncbi:MAG: cation diffusion facilitator family transporter, partial [Cutibacterium avidum]|nr:cation diffusion facilitator family transporter [Cutibacterium avidum]
MTTIPDISEAPPRHRPPDDLSRFAWLSIAAAAVTILLKTLAWRITGSVGLLSDAAESLVNLVAAIIALVALKVSIRPPDKNHPFGHSKAEYFSAGAEGMMIFIAAAVIMYTAVQRFIHPRPIEDVGIGLLVSVLASVVNGLVAWVLLK